ncbi:MULTISPECIES: hypothetical protein [Vibrio]|uniref:Uncharacterized protein n=1 Tax=Vibrio aestuarianus TaxID=28171 RepID=A0ABM9FQ89_9VIBR|nr:MULTISPECIES: hypothetical protein [Vibrio]MDE1213077.1 hypothetical protein [Vibrio aestuarianus]MDE1216939.1 hypothetical protein [Vibrio aestuarianus]MDE1228355.1 hypothetical protein [Vibrio aestuarianus]MDE1256672.1 hypothetical protein [Vibrio aestuarianus]MDE1260134.1 hypothetical protein [Vibrio aestuarianus]
MAKVTLHNKTFRSKKSANEHYMNLRDSITGAIEDGELFEELKELYIKYCDATKWNNEGRIIKNFIVGYEPRVFSGKYVQYKCYKVNFSNNETRPFSIQKALNAI